jgi:hypothetical protein
VAGLTGCALHAVPDAAIENDAAADAGAEGVHEERIDGVGAASAEEAFTVGGERGVVSDVDRAIETALELESEVKSVEAGKVRRMVQDADGELDGTGTADADTEEFAGMFFDDLANGGGHVVEDGVRACAEARGEADGVEALACGSDGGDAEVCASEVHANAEGIHDERKAYDTLRGSGSLQAEQAMLGCWKPDGPTELLQKDAWTESGL